MMVTMVVNVVTMVVTMVTILVNYYGTMVTDKYCLAMLCQYLI